MAAAGGERVLRLSKSVDEADLSEEIRRYPVLYDGGEKHFKNKRVRDNAWKEIGVALRVSDVDALPVRYKSIRRKASQLKLKIQKRNKSGAGVDDPDGGDAAVDKDLDALQWLFPWIKSRKVVTNDPSNSDAEDGEGNLSDGQDPGRPSPPASAEAREPTPASREPTPASLDLSLASYVDEAEVIPAASTSGRRPAPERRVPGAWKRKKTNEKDEVESAIAGLLKQDDDEATTFAKGLIPDLRKLSPLDFMLAKQGINNLLSGAVVRGLQANSATYNMPPPSHPPTPYAASSFAGMGYMPESFLHQPASHQQNSYTNNMHTLQNAQTNNMHTLQNAQTNNMHNMHSMHTLQNVHTAHTGIDTQSQPQLTPTASAQLESQSSDV